MDASERRSLYVMRHAERMDFAFGDWITPCFDKNGLYIRKDLNMPVSMPNRTGSPATFFKDGPLTNIGLYQATLTGEAMKESNVLFSNVFSSASLRCVETCTNVLKASGQADLPINVEPGLFEWQTWYEPIGMPTWMSLCELKAARFNVSLDYKPVHEAADMTNTSETVCDYYMRSFLIMKRILEKYPVGNLLFVAHAASLDTCTRQLIGRAPRDYEAFKLMVQRTSYASVMTAEEQPDRSWKLQPPPFPSASVTHCDNARYECEMLLNS